jgi:hypothetical protein
MFEVLRGGHKPSSVFPEAIASPRWWECNAAGFPRRCACIVPYLVAQMTWPIVRAAVLASDLGGAPPRQDVLGMGYASLVCHRGRVVLGMSMTSGSGVEGGLDPSGGSDSSVGSGGWLPSCPSFP